MSIKTLFKRIRGDFSGNTDLEKLIEMGLKVGKNLDLQPGCIIDKSHCFLISIGDNVTLAPRVHILAHDGSTSRYLNCTIVGLVEIGDNSFIGASSIILPGVKIGSNVIVGSNSVVTKDIPDNCVYTGNPARYLCSTDEYITKQKSKMNENNTFDKSYRVEYGVTEDKKKDMREKLKNGIGYLMNN